MEAGRTVGGVVAMVVGTMGVMSAVGGVVAMVVGTMGVMSAVGAVMVVLGHLTLLSRRKPRLLRRCPAAPQGIEPD